MSIVSRIYLDNAATSWPKPEAVYAAIDDYQRRLGAPAGRGAYDEAIEVERLVIDTRQRLARLIGAPERNRIVFGYSGTDVLNTAIHGVLRPGDRVVTSAAEHNSVLRPLRWLAEHRQIEVDYVPCAKNGVLDPSDFAAELRAKTKLVVVTHASNVTGAIQPIGEIAKLAHTAGACILIDAAQSLGHLEIDVEQLGVDLLAAPGHKGLLGPLGTGVLYIAPSVSEEVESFRQGGTGTQSDEELQPVSLPEKFEAGNLNVPGIVGLRAALMYLEERGMANIRRHELELTERLINRLATLAEIEQYGPAASSRVGVVSFNAKGYDPRELAALLDSAARVQVRAGFHCAPRMHAALGTTKQGGTVRLSVGAFSTNDQIDAAAAAIAEIVAAS